jgi:hypothetical protein
MSDLRNQFERLGARAEVAPDAFERLERARRRHERNRKIAAGTVALLIAVAGSVAAFTAFRGPGGPVAGASGGVGVTAPAPAGPADVAGFTCDSTGTIAPSSLTVEAQRDGVHVAVTNTADERISFTVSGGESSIYFVDQGGADPGERGEVVLGVPPGDAKVSCVLDSMRGIDTSPVADLTVKDPTGSYVPIGMDCPTSNQDSGVGESAVRFQGDPVEVARQHLSGLEYDEAVERAGYPSDEKPIVRVVRNGDVVAMATFKGDEEGGWLIETLLTCVDVPIAWSDDVTGVSGPMGSPSPPTAWDQLCSSARADGSNTAHNGSDMRVVGDDLGFDTRCLIAPPGEPITIHLDNGDDGVLRNVSVYELTPYLRECIVTATQPSQDVDHPLFAAEFVVGVGETIYRLGPLEPGEYYFQDDVHPSANGVLVVE